MKSALVLFVLALSFLECEQLPSRVLSCLGCTSSDRNAYENLFKSKKKVTVALQPDCSGQMDAVFVDEPDDTRRFNPTGPCNTGVPDRKPGYKEQINIYINPPPNVISPRPGVSGKAFYLLSKDNKNTYMVLDAAKAHWFFTTPLSDSDMFVATHPKHPQKPLLIHANRKSAVGAGVAQYQASLNLKKTSTDTIIHNNDGYVLNARLHPNIDAMASGMVDYWNAYDAAHPSVSRKAYSQPGRVLRRYTFYGFYNLGTASWTFKYKGETDGIVGDICICP